MNRFGIIGFPLLVSFSKTYFSEKFEREHLQEHIYELFPLQDISAFPDIVKTHPDVWVECYNSIQKSSCPLFKRIRRIGE